jgi:cytochrome c biogenesis protein CcdA/thiol-disulfide isomerase/thioredoxin
VTLIVLSYLGGVLTILSPCILPVLPFIFARADKPFVTNTLPMLGGMAITFAAVATLAAVGGGWVVRANEYGRYGAMAVLAMFGLLLLWPALADHLMRPLVTFGNRLADSTTRAGTVAPAVLTGVAVGFLWAPCAGPILGLVLTGAALNGANATTSLLLFAYAAGAATSLALALLIGGRVFMFLKQTLGAGDWIRRGLGVAVIGAVVVIAMGMDTGFLTRVSLAGTSRVEQALIGKIRSRKAPLQEEHGTVSDEGDLPPLSGAVAWLNSSPLTPQGLRGRVVLVDFWTYSCINCLRTLPYIRAWANKYRDHGLVVIGVHTPEFAFEKNVDNVRRAVGDLGIPYPIAVDNNYAIWRSFSNEYWPADYFIDGDGHIRGHEFGEGNYDKSEQLIQTLLREAGFSNVPTGLVNVRGTGIEAAADMQLIRSPETYIGYERAQNFDNAGGIARDRTNTYSEPAAQQLNKWGLAGAWTVGAEKAVLDSAPGRIVFRFHARDLHLVLGPSAEGKPVRFRVLLDGKAPGENHGVDIDAEGAGTVTRQRLYQLIRQTGTIEDHTFEIEFQDPGVQAFAFTFG